MNILRKLRVLFGSATQKDVLHLVSEQQQKKVLSEETMRIVEGAFNLEQMQVSDAMLPRPAIVSFRVDQDIDEIIAEINESAHSRYPVFDASNQEVIGVLLAKDLLSPTVRSDTKVMINQLMRQPVFLPITTPLHRVLETFRTSRNHLIIVQNEYGTVVGVITIEDVLELIVGTIADEFDEEEEDNIVTLDNNKEIYRIVGTTLLSEVNRELDLAIDDREADTIGGWAVLRFGKLPQRGDKLELNDSGIRLEVVEVAGKLIGHLQVSKLKVTDEQDNNGQ